MLGPSLLYRPLPLLTMTFDNPKMLSVDDAAARLGLSPQHVRRLVEAGELEVGRADEFSRELDDAGARPE